MRYLGPLIVVIGGWSLGALAQGAAPAAPQPAPPPDPAVLLAQQLASKEPAQADAALAAIGKMMAEEPSRAASHLRSTWFKPMMEARKFDALDELALRAILALAHDLATIESLQTLRVRAMIEANKGQAALGYAKSLYNVASMNGTGAAMLLVAECLNAASPGDVSQADRFRREQVAGAIFDGLMVVAAGSDGSLPPTTRPAPKVPPAPPGPSVLGRIKVDAGPYLAPMSRLHAEDIQTLMAKGNLLLLADRAADARGVFERAYGLALPHHLQQTTEALARCMKAEDGTVGRANAWVYSIHPRVRKRN